MKAFMDNEFLLSNEMGSRLFHEYAENCPIIDYHNHLSVKDIFERRRYENLTEVWLQADHYKWRCMRACGVPESHVTGDAPDFEKFLAFAKVMPRLVGSPVYHWAHLELQRYFGIDTPLTEATAPAIWNKTAEMLESEGFDAVSLLEKMQVKVICTTDDPADDLFYHRKIAAESGLSFAVLPSFRPDRFLNIDNAAQFEKALTQLSARYGRIESFEGLCDALKKSLDYFADAGCRVTDHGFLRFRYASCGNAAAIFKKATAKELLTTEEIAVYQGALLRFLGKEYAQRNMVMQLHLGPIRNNSPKLFASFGADAGGDSIGEATNPFQLSAFLADLERDDAMPRTILYNLNPADSAMLSTLAVDYAADGAKVQYGAAWWFHDHIRGIRAQIDQLLETGAIASSVGMLTDSRSFTSFVRHEYYRRILCDKLGALVEAGEYPADLDTLGTIVEDICWKNAASYFGFKL
ncbi:MAG: glucuronate isomerase [Clostridiales bacterium]|nr:glucuronate isomerase [Clostridiales bacterium]